LQALLGSSLLNLTNTLTKLEYEQHLRHFRKGVVMPAEFEQTKEMFLQAFKEALAEYQEKEGVSLEVEGTDKVIEKNIEAFLKGELSKDEFKEKVKELIHEAVQKEREEFLKEIRRLKEELRKEIREVGGEVKKAEEKLESEVWRMGNELADITLEGVEKARRNVIEWIETSIDIQDKYGTAILKQMKFDTANMENNFRELYKKLEEIEKEAKYSAGVLMMRR